MSIKKILTEDLDPKSKGLLTMMGFKIVDDQRIGTYDIALMSHPIHYYPYQYTIGLQKIGRSFMSPEDQHAKESYNQGDMAFMKQLPDLIRKWVDQYGTIIVGSFNDKKSQLYFLGLQRAGLNVRWVHGFPVKTFIIEP